MKKTLIILSTLLLIACQEQDLDVNPAQMIIQFIHPSAVTKVTDSSFENGDRIGLYVVESPASLQVSGNYINNLQAIYNGTSWTGDSGLRWPATTSTRNL